MPDCENCGGFVTDQYVRVFAPTGMDNVRVCLRDGAEVREAHSPRHTNNG